MTNLSKLVLKKRSELGLTQTDLEKASGLSQSKISKIENGEQEVTMRDFARLMKALELKVQVVKEYEYE